MRQYLRETPEGAIEAWPFDLSALWAEGIHVHDRTEARVLAKHRVQIVRTSPAPNAAPGMIWELETTPQKRGQFWTREWVQRSMTLEEAWARLPYKTALEAKLAMTGWINNLTAQIKNKYPEVVQAAWEEEEAMAAAYLAGTEDAAQLAILTADAASKNRTPAEHAARILEKAQLFRTIALQTRNLWLSVDRQLDDAEPAQYAAILQGAITQAAPLAAAAGLSSGAGS